MNRETVEKAKVIVEHPLMAALTTFTVVGVALATLANITGLWDATHTSARELKIVTDQIAAVDLRVSEAGTKASCENLAIRISLVEQAIWQMEQANVTSQRLVEKRRELKDLEDKFRSLRCARLLQ